MATRAFRILYRDFLFRVVDRELLSPHSPGDAHHVYTQIAAALMLFSLAISIPATDLDEGFSAPVRLFFAWRFEHFLIATTMLAVGVLAILSWGAMFPDHRDVRVLAPLPVRARTILLAKVAAVGTALALAVLAMHGAAGLIWPLALSRTSAAIEMPSFTRDPAIPPVPVRDLQSILDRDLAGARTHGWLAPRAGGGLAIAISQRGERRVLTYGAARADSIFQIGSVTKTFTAFALARMVHENSVRLDTPVRDLLPPADIPTSAIGRRDITLLDLATHRSGLPMMPAGIRPDRRHSPFAAFGRSSLYDYLRRRGLDKPAETRFVYSNLGFGLLGHALAIQADADYASLIRRLITEPLQLNDSAIVLTREQRARAIHGYDDDGQPVDAWAFDVLEGAGGMYSTAPDLLRWLEATLHPADPLAPAFDLARQPRAGARGNQQIGLAWMIDRATGSVGHGGAVGGYTADVYFNPADDLALAVLANRGPGVVAAASRVAEHIRARLYGTPALSLDDLVVPGAGGVRASLRMMLAYWVTMIAASAFIVGTLLAAQGVALAMLPRRQFVRVSPVLQCTAFATLVSGYLLQPLGFTAEDLVAAQAGPVWSASPSYWFLGLFQALNGSTAMPVLASRALAGVAFAIGLAVLAYAASYVCTLHGIAEEPDGTAAARRWRFFTTGDGETRALVRFALTTLARSAQPRVLMAFYWGFGFALAVAFVRTPRAQALASPSTDGAWHESSLPLLVASILMMAASIAAACSAFAMPRDLPSNWIFRMLPLREPRIYAVARRRALFAVSVVPVALMSAVAFFWMWPWMPALGHVLALTLLGLTIVEFAEGGSRTIPFACSYLPGRRKIHIALLVVVLVVIPLAVEAARIERDALQGGTLYAGMIAAFAISWAVARWRTICLPPKSDPMPAFDAEPEDHPVTLQLWDVASSRRPNPLTSARPRPAARA